MITATPAPQATNVARAPLTTNHTIKAVGGLWDAGRGAAEGETSASKNPAPLPPNKK